MNNTSKRLSFKIILPTSLENERKTIQQAFLNAESRLMTFADFNGWSSLTQKPFIQEARIFDSKDKFVEFAIEFLECPPETKLPDAFSAALEKDVFFSVSPRIYNEIYPDAREPNAFEKLITHEMAHRLHVRILNGNEEAMGPIWFYEGFSIFASNQFEVSNPELTEKEIWSIVESPDRGSYRKYATVIRFFMKKTSLKEMIAHASNTNFTEWLRSL